MRRRDLTVGLLATGVAAPFISPTMAMASQRGEGPDRLAPIDYVDFGVQLKIRAFIVGSGEGTAIRLEISRKFAQSRDTSQVIFGNKQESLSQVAAGAEEVSPVWQLDRKTIFADAGVGLSALPPHLRMGNGKTVFDLGYLKNLKPTETSVPFLGDAPIIGALFRTTETRRDQQELIVLVKAHITRDQS